jgi:hypothetical protein
MHTLVLLTAALSTLAAEPASAPAEPPSPTPPPAAASTRVEERPVVLTSAEQKRVAEAAAGRVVVESLAGLGVNVMSMGLYGLARAEGSNTVGPHDLVGA